MYSAIIWWFYPLASKSGNTAPWKWAINALIKTAMTCYGRN